MSDRGSALGQDAARVRAEVAALVARARAAQREIDGCDQARADELAIAAAWAIVEPSRNRALAGLAVRDTGMGDAADKFARTGARRWASCATSRGSARPASSPRTTSAA
jgi:sulfoacetaldehyde dehydrogenase